MTAMQDVEYAVGEHQRTWQLHEAGGQLGGRVDLGFEVEWTTHASRMITRRAAVFRPRSIELPCAFPIVSMRAAKGGCTSMHVLDERCVCCRFLVRLVQRSERISRRASD